MIDTITSNHSNRHSTLIRQSLALALLGMSITAGHSIATNRAVAPVRIDHHSTGFPDTGVSYPSSSQSTETTPSNGQTSQNPPTARERFGLLRSLAESDNPGVAADFVSLAKASPEPAVRRDAMFNAALLLTRSSVATWRRPPLPQADGTPPAPTPFAQIRDQLAQAASMFRAAVREDPNDPDTARHLELVRHLIHKLDKEMERRQEQSEQRTDLAKKLDELAEQQERLAQQSEQAASEDAAGLAQQQSAIDQETQELLDRLESMDREQQAQSDNQESSPDAPSSEAVVRAREARSAQESAQRELSDQLTKPAAEAQREAGQHLRNAAKAAREQAEQDQSAEQTDSKDSTQDGEQQNTQQQETDASEPSESEDPTEELLDQLDQNEQDNRERREAIRRTMPSRTAPVERDW